MADGFLSGDIKVSFTSPMSFFASTPQTYISLG